MKRRMSYDELLTVADNLTSQISKATKDLGYNDLNLVAVSRGGVTAAHRIAYNLAKPLNYWSPMQGLAWPLTPGLPVFFIEDLVAKGRTHDLLTVFMVSQRHPEPWCLCPLIVDKGYVDEKGYLPFAIYGSVEEDWIVFPYEDFDRVQEKDWGLFREGTAQSAIKGETNG